MFSKITIYTLKRFALLTIVGIFIHLLQKQDILLMSFLLVFVVLAIKRKWNTPNRTLYYLGFTISALMGVCAELWGITNNLWEYHGLPNGREFPLWLPCAWGLAFSFLHSFESFYVKHLKLDKFKKRLILAIIVSIIIPTHGEIVTVNLGVWTYHSNYMLFGIPYYAMFLLCLFHTSIFTFLHYFEKSNTYKSLTKNNTIIT